MSVVISVDDKTNTACVLLNDLLFSYNTAGLSNSDERSKMVYPTLVETDLFVDASIHNVRILDLNGIVVK